VGGDGGWRLLRAVPGRHDAQHRSLRATPAAQGRGVRAAAAGQPASPRSAGHRGAIQRAGKPRLRRPRRHARSPGHVSHSDRSDRRCQPARDHDWRRQRRAPACPDRRCDGLARRSIRALRAEPRRRGSYPAAAVTHRRRGPDLGQHRPGHGQDRQLRVRPRRRRGGHDQAHADRRDPAGGEQQDRGQVPEPQAGLPARPARHPASRLPRGHDPGHFAAAVPKRPGPVPAAGQGTASRGDHRLGDLA
jgi:hypothetical protein